MNSYILLIPVVVSFLITLALLPFWIRKAREVGLMWKDMNKHNKIFVSGSGGVIVILGFVIGVLLYVSYNVFLLNSKDGRLVEIFALISCILMLASLGFIDDLFGWIKGGLSKRSRIILVAISSIPLMVINAGKSVTNVPFVGSVDVGILYPLLVIPIGIVGATTTFNFLAGFNGLEAGQGILLLSSLAIVSYLTGSSWLALIALCMIASLFAFLLFNFSPAKILPGDSLTYAVGGLVAIMAILGDFERIAIFFFIPCILETILKLRGRLKKHSFGKPNKDGTLDLNYDKIYSLNHAAIFFMNKLGIKPTERKVVFLVWTFQFAIILIGLIIFRRGL